MGALELKDLLPDSIISILEDNEIIYSVSEQDGRYIAELEWYSRYGGDNIFNIWFDYNGDKNYAAESFAEALSEYYMDWDIDEHVEMWLDAKHPRPNICPLNARQLVEDGEQIDDFLCNLSNEVHDAVQARFVK